jgi:hypothetical protein
MIILEKSVRKRVIGFDMLSGWKRRGREKKRWLEKQRKNGGWQ